MSFPDPSVHALTEFPSKVEAGMENTLESVVQNSTINDHMSDTESQDEIKNREHMFYGGPVVIQPSLSSSDQRNKASSESSIRSDVVCVDIGDYGGEDSINLTTTTLKKCKREVLRPYWRLLMFIGWRGFGRESINPTSYPWRILNICYTVMVFTLLIYSYVYEVVNCQWKLNISKDTGRETTTTTVKPPTTTPMNVSTEAPWSNMSAAQQLEVTSARNLSDAKPSANSACEHVLTTYVIPNILHFVAYIIGFLYFRVFENEQLYALMEKVFLQATPLQGRLVSQSNMIRKLRFFLVFGAGWVILTLVLHVLFVLAFGIPAMYHDHSSRAVQYWVMFAFQILGTMVTSSVTLAVIVNYASQCEILIFYINGIQVRMQEKSGHLRGIIMDIFTVRKSLCQLNGAMSRMTSLVVVTLSEMVVIGVTILIRNKYLDLRIWIYRAFFPVIWCIMLLFALIQAARTNSACAKFKRLALEARVFGFQNTSSLELDSFVLFVSNTQLRAKLFHIPVRPSYLIGFLVLTSFVVLVLLQAGIIGNHRVPFWI